MQICHFSRSLPGFWWAGNSTLLCRQTFRTREGHTPQCAGKYISLLPINTHISRHVYSIQQRIEQMNRQFLRGAVSITAMYDKAYYQSFLRVRVIQYLTQVKLVFAYASDTVPIHTQSVVWNFLWKCASCESARLYGSQYEHSGWEFEN